jgi:hypothetical protein
MNAGPTPRAHPTQGERTAGVSPYKDHGPRAYTTPGARAGHASGGWVVGRYRARSPRWCGCCHCRVLRGEPVYEVLTDSGVLDVCAECVGAT